jgi:hypothetical protein
MKMSQIAAATLVPATLAGALLTAMPFAQAAPTPATVAARTVHHAAPARPAKATKPARPHHVTAHAVAHQPASSSNTAGASSAQTPAPASQAAAPAQPATVSQPLTAGMSAFEQCVAWRESGDNPTASSAGLFGILPSTWVELGYSGTAGQASVAQQETAFNQLYAQYGAQPWAPSDGC